MPLSKAQNKWHSPLARIWLVDSQILTEYGSADYRLQKTWSGSTPTLKKPAWLVLQHPRIWLFDYPPSKHLIGWIPGSLKSHWTWSRPWKDLIGWILELEEIWLVERRRGSKQQIGWLTVSKESDYAYEKYFPKICSFDLWPSQKHVPTQTISFHMTFLSVET
jgi:hypothetical protein